MQRSPNATLTGIRAGVTTYEIIVMAIIGAIGGVILAHPFGDLWVVGYSLFGPMGGWWVSFWEFPPLLVAFLTKKPKLIWLCYWIHMTTEMLAGQFFGFYLYLFVLSKGTILWAFFHFTKSKIHKWWFYVVAAGTALWFGNTVWPQPMLSGWAYNWDLVASMPWYLIVGGLESGLLAFGLGKLIQKTV